MTTTARGGGWLPPRGQSGRRIAAAVAIATLVAFRLLSLRGLVAPGEAAGGDMIVHLAEIRAIADALASGDAGGWSRAGNLGFPSGYYYQVLPQLLTAVAWLALRTTLAIGTVQKLVLAATIAVAPVTLFVALRWARVARGPAVGAVAGVVLVVCGDGRAPAVPDRWSAWGVLPDCVFVTGLYTQAFALAVYPLAVAATATYLLNGRRLSRALVWTTVTVLCHPFFGLAVAATLVATRWWSGRRPWRAAAWALGCLVFCSPVWLPLVIDGGAFGAFPSRRPVEAGIKAAALARIALRGELLDGRVFAVLSLLAGMGLVAAARRRRGVLASLALQATVFAVVLAVGPLVGKTSGDLVPAIRFTAPLQLPLACIAGFVAAELVRRGAHLAAHGPLPTRIASGILLLVGAGIVIDAAHASLRRWEARAITSPATGLDRARVAALASAMAPLPPGRFAVSSRYANAAAWWYMLPALDGRHEPLVGGAGAALQSSMNYAYVRHAHAADAVVDEVFGVRYRLAKRGELAEPEWREVARAGDDCVFERAGATTFASIEIAGAIHGRREVLHAAVTKWLIGEGGIDGHYLAINRRLEPRPRVEVAVTDEVVAPSAYSATLDVPGASPAWVVVHTTFHPRWRAWLDGHPAPLVEVTPAQPGLDVPPGRHRVVLRFERPWWYWSAWMVTVGGALVAVGLGLRGVGRVHRRV